MDLARRVFTRFKEAASEIPLDEVPADRQKLIKLLESFGLEPEMAWEGIHGIIVSFKGGHMLDRLTKDMLKKLVADPKFRWIEPNMRNGLSVGM